MTEYPVWDSLLPPSAHGRDSHRIVRVSGNRAVFADGVDAIDGTSGLWNVNLGYGNEAIAAAITGAVRDASYMSLFRRTHDYAIEAAAALIEAAGPARYSRVLFSTSGSSANDAMMKLARHHALLRGDTHRKVIVGLEGSYHGQTYGSFTLSGDDLSQHLYGVDTSLIRHVKHDDPAAMRALLTEIGDQVAAVVIEPVLGTGAHVVPAEMISTLLELRREHGFLLVCDEVAFGFGRSGSLFGSDRWAESPDLLVTSKGLTNGTCAASAILVGHSVFAEFAKADAMFVHGETQAGTPASCAAIVATLQQFDELHALESGARVAKLLEEGLKDLVDRVELAVEVTGAGCFRGLGLRAANGAELWPLHITKILSRIRDRGAVVQGGPSSIELIPPLTCTEDEVGELLRAVELGLADFTAERQAKRARVRPSSSPAR
ncbi:aminotransferase class III-fold pyridoxal phosphate-dependent enzyme [Micromonospora sp. NIE79]|uniref:Aminotransferase class III-fold pyridoxal phosphate-dependent enzyme n=1 Tax=Micromonospora trifolii TaxID=2911208 RepID=A0ABS9N840_9ACTN|nr:daptide-type RiPP biosynthesis aminotransferase [Micromonospora trifolii]MCG5445424.1 aminotransferase class III-fold pyridoxal phosphate-dependent enzyme [Micromonospora trifolii]